MPGKKRYDAILSTLPHLTVKAEADRLQEEGTWKEETL
jgi:hypothetical protein